MTQDEEFSRMMFRSVVEEVEAIMAQIIFAEAQSRHEMACNDDPEAANAAANRAYATLMEVKLRELPTLIMGLADKFNREHEAYTKLLDEIQDVQEHLRQFDILKDRGQDALAQASVLAAQSIIVGALADALYERVDES